LKKKITLTVFPAEIKFNNNEYSKRFRTDMFQETIRINNITCVYRQWEFTQYVVESLPLSHF